MAFFYVLTLFLTVGVKIYVLIINQLQKYFIPFVGCIIFCYTIASIKSNQLKQIKMTISCISVHGIKHEMVLLKSDLEGYYLYKLIPMELGYDPKIMYIAPNRADHWMYGKPMEGGKQISHSEILYFHTYKK